jgi:hypothetical protein
MLACWKHAQVFPRIQAAGYFWATAVAFFCAAQRRLTASAMRLRPSGERFLFFFFAGLAIAGATAATTFLGLPGFFFAGGAEAPTSNARAFCNCAISLSMLAKMSESAMDTP